MFKKTDLILIAAIVVISFGFMLGIYLIPFEGEAVINVYVDGQKTDSFSFDQEYVEVPIETSYGYNLLIISENMAFIDESDCTTRSCISKGAISRPGSMIVCAPHHLVIKIETLPEGESR